MKLTVICPVLFTFISHNKWNIQLNLQLGMLKHTYAHLSELDFLQEKRKIYHKKPSIRSISYTTNKSTLIVIGIARFRIFLPFPPPFLLNGQKMLFIHVQKHIKNTSSSIMWILSLIKRTMFTTLKYNRAFTNSKTVQTLLTLINNNKYSVIYTILNFIPIQNKIDQDGPTNHFSFLSYI